MLVDEHREFQRHQPAVDRFIPDPVVVVVDPARLVEERFGPVEILLVGEQFLPRSHPARLVEITCGRLIEPVAELLEHPIVVEGVAHRPPHPPVGKEGGVEVPAKMEVHPFRRRNLRVALGKILSLGLRCPLLGQQDHLVDFPRLERQQCGVGIFDDPEADLLEERLFPHHLPPHRRPVGPAPQHDLLPARPFHDFIRPTADWLFLQLEVRRAVLERGILLPGIGINMLREHGEVDVPHVGRQRFLVEEDDGSVVIGVHPSELIGAAAHGWHRHTRIHDHPIREGEVVRRDRLAVAPLKVVAQHHLVEQAIGAGLP